MANTTQKVNLLQTAYNAAATITAALIATGEVEDPKAVLEDLKSTIFSDLSTTHDAEPAPAPAPRRTYNKGGSSGRKNDLDPATLEIKVNPHKGRTIGQVYETHPDWVTWYAASGQNEFLKTRCQAFLAQVKGEASGAKADYF